MALCVLLAGCGADTIGAAASDEEKNRTQMAQGSAEMTQDATEMTQNTTEMEQDTDDMMRETTEMTEQEKQLMLRLAADKQAVEEGILDEWEKGILEEIRAGEAYLKEKYPSSRLEIIGCEAGTSVRAYNTYTFLEAGDEEHYYEMRISSGADGNDYDIRDDYYGRLIREEAQNLVKEMIEKAGLPCIKVKASFDSFLGKEYGAGISADDVLRGAVPADNSWQIYLEEAKLDHGSYVSNVQEVKQAMEKAGIIGYFTVIIGTEDSRESVYRESFSR